jgi:hypothetical protein
MSMHSDHHSHWYDLDTTTWQTVTVAVVLLALAGLMTWINMSGQSLQVMGQSISVP